MGGLRIIGLLAIVCLTVSAQDEVATDTQVEESLVRCPRVECFAGCDYGVQKDEAGCPTCDCEPSPCETHECSSGQECQVRQCDDHPCVPYVPECVGTPCDQRPMCRMFCPYDFLDGDDGCPICTCNWDPCYKSDCEEGYVCQPYKPNCTEGDMDCKMEARCIVPVDVRGVLPGILPGVLPVMIDTDKSDESDDSAEPEHECPLAMCAMACQFGFRTDENGCRICDCNLSPCETTLCAQGHVCKVAEESCGAGEDEQTCHRAHCVLQTLCLRAQTGPHLLGQDEASLGPAAHSGHHLLGQDEASLGPAAHSAPHLLGQDEASLGPAAHSGPHLLGQDAESRGPAGAQPMPTPQPLLGAPGSHAPHCTADGSFEPTQCCHDTGNCWCVDDRGHEVEGTRRNLRTNGARAPICPVNITTSLHGHMSLEHDVPDVVSNMDQLQEAMHNSLSEWLVVAREYIIIDEVSLNSENIHIIEVTFIVRTDEDAPHDLATSSLHLQDQVMHNALQMLYQGHVLRPIPHGVSVNHQYHPMLPPVGVRHREDSFYRQHQSALLSCFIGVTFFLIILTAIVKILMTRRRSKSLLLMHEEPQDLYKQNLKFGSKLTHIGDEDKKVVLSDAEVMSQEALA